jgi:hypothetical protein
LKSRAEDESSSLSQVMIVSFEKEKFPEWGWKETGAGMIPGEDCAVNFGEKKIEISRQQKRRAMKCNVRVKFFFIREILRVILNHCIKKRIEKTKCNSAQQNINELQDFLVAF